MKSTVIIQASAQSFGNTYKIINYLNKNNNYDVIDLATKNIGHFNYNYENANDDFLPLIEKIIHQYDTIIFVTPVYWYTMSGHLKVFFDRMSDLLHYKKELGRKMRGKKMAMISNSNDNDRHDSFNIPFIKSSDYLGMEYLGDIHTYFNNDEIHNNAMKAIDNFRDKLL